MIVIDFSQLVFNNLFVLQKHSPKKSQKREYDVRREYDQNLKESTDKIYIRQSSDREVLTLDESLNLLKHLIINQILSIVKLYKDETEVVLATDTSSWRKQCFKSETGEVLYKAARKKSRDADDFDWEAFWNKFSEFQEELKEHFPFIYVSVKNAEGDDVIGTLAEYVNERNILTKKNERFIIVSSDKDFIQLLRFNNVVQYSPMKKKEVKCVNPSNELMWLILQGDRCDGIPNVKSPDDAFITGNTVRMWSSKIVWRHIENNTVFESLIMDEAMKKNFNRNKKLIDLRECPDDIKKEIVDTYKENKEKLKTKTQLNLFTFFIRNKMNNLTNRVDDFAKFFIDSRKTKSQDTKDNHKPNNDLMSFYKSN